MELQPKPLFKERSRHGPVHHLLADGISRLRADLVTVGIDPGRAPFEHRSRATASRFSLDNLICQCSNILVLDVEVIQSPQAAAAALDPVRARLLAELSEPASAATLAARLSLPRQKLNYHLPPLHTHHPPPPPTHPTPAATPAP